VCVIDPGVGTERDAVIVRTKNYVFIGPDNGLLYPAANDDGIERIMEFSIAEPISATFHGRDLFAKAGGYIAQNSFDRIISSPKNNLDIPLHFHLERRCGEVVRIDHFGNIITNITPLDTDSYNLSFNDIKRPIKWVPTYEDGPDQDIFLLTGSAGTLEVSAKNRSAIIILKVQIGDRITIE
jgi:S-adenosylmethionine hydrolase